jgi:hypothetical protein
MISRPSWEQVISLSLRPKAHAVVDHLAKRVGTSPGFHEIDGLRQTAGHLFEQADKTERKVGSIIIRSTLTTL